MTYIVAMNELTPAEKRALKARAHPLVPVILVGDKGLTGAVLTEVERALSAHELIKIRVQAERGERAAILGEICAKTGASAVQHIGKVLVVYRKKPPEPPKPRIRSQAPKPGRKPLARKSAGGRDDPPRRPRRPSTSTGRPESRTASPRRAPARPPGRRRISR